MVKLRGTIFERDNGKFTVLAEPTWDPRQNKYRRPSLGTFETRKRAEKELFDYNHDHADGVFSLPEVEQRQVFDRSSICGGDCPRRWYGADERDDLPGCG